MSNELFLTSVVHFTYLRQEPIPTIIYSGAHKNMEYTYLKEKATGTAIIIDNHNPNVGNKHIIPL